MKLPLTPPKTDDIFSSLKDVTVNELFLNIRDIQETEYYHWDKLRHLEPPTGANARQLTHDEWWLILKLRRKQSAKQLKNLTPARGAPFHYTLPDFVLSALHDIDSRARGQLAVSDTITNTEDRNRYVVSSLIEEAITSSQLEGAATTRKDAVDMLRSGRQPRDHSERMIMNNYLAMQHIRDMGDQPLTPEAVLRLHTIVSKDTLENPLAVGTLQKPDDERVYVADHRDNTVLHTPPPAAQLPQRLQALCDFANHTQDEGHFMHPVLRAIILHFMLGYDHPFEDGNGRTARALFYWAMLKQGYWLFEYVSISSLLRKAPAKYSRSFQYVETDENDLTYFIISQLSFIQRALDELDKYLARKRQQLQDAEQHIQGMAWLNPRQRALMAHALRHPTHQYTIESHQRSHSCAYGTARSDLLQLVEKGLLLQGKMGGKKMVFTPTASTNK